MRHILGLLNSVRRNGGVEVFDDGSILHVLNAVDQLASNTESRGDNTSGMTTVHSLFHNFNSQVSSEHSSERGGHPELLVVAATTVQADNQSRDL